MDKREDITDYYIKRYLGKLLSKVDLRISLDNEPEESCRFKFPVLYDQKKKYERSKKDKLDTSCVQ